MGTIHKLPAIAFGDRGAKIRLNCLGIAKRPPLPPSADGLAARGVPAWAQLLAV